MQRRIGRATYNKNSTVTNISLTKGRWGKSNNEKNRKQKQQEQIDFKRIKAFLQDKQYPLNRTIPIIILNVGIPNTPITRQRSSN